ncbi:MAG: trimethylamine methyltransferase family protein [Kiloniellales bacterium]|nr:trimethylamine methyltransferase family protein [Kiloniellales bacterium]
MSEVVEKVVSIEGAAEGGGRGAGRGGGRRGRRARDSGDRTSGIEQPAWQQPRNPYPPVPVVSEDELEAVHLASLKILEEVGMDFLHEEAKSILKAAGAEVAADGDRVRFDRGLVESMIGKAPRHFTLHARNPAHNVEIGENWCAFCCASSAPNSADRDGGRRPGNLTDFRDLVKLAQAFNIIHLIGGYPVEPVDIHPSIRHLDCLSDTVKLSDKAFNAYSLGRERNLDALEITRIARGITDAQLEREPSLFTIINSSSPLRLDTPMLQGIIEMARRNQIVVLTPFTLAGAMAPVTVAGAVVQQNAEALAGLVFTQLVNPGAPFIYGGFTSNVDMKSGAPAFGTPEYMRSALLGGQLARRYGLPYRSSNVCAANTLDAQAAYESVFSLWGAIMGGVNFLKHGAGWMEGGLQTSFEKVVLDVDLLQMVASFMMPLETDEAGLALDAMREVGPGGHFFGAAHTQARYKNAFYTPLISDWRNYESWEEAGRPEAYGTANRIYKDMLKAYEPPPLDPAIREELDAFVARRKEEGGAPTDF